MRRLLVLLTLCLAAPVTAQHHPLPERTPVAATPEGRAADIAYFRSHFLARDVSYTPAARAEAERRLARLEADRAQVSQAAFDLELARIVALADNGHSHYVVGLMSRFYDRVPIRLAVFENDLHVVRATAANADLLGSRLLSIDGHAAAELRTAGRALWGGVPAYRDRMVTNLFESPELLQAAGLAAGTGGALYRFEKPDGTIVERRLDGEPPSPTRPFVGPIGVVFPEPLDLEGDRWRTALAADRAPWSLQERDRVFRSRAAPELQAVVLQLRSNTDWQDERIGPALEQFERLIRAQRPANLVVDMRQNPGGDLNTTRDFMQRLPQLVPGRIFVLTSPLTFSAAIASVGYVKQAAPDRVTIVGEPVGDRLVFFAEGSGMNLPNDGVGIGYATERHDYANGCRAFTDCHRAVVRNPIAVSGLDPDIPAPWRIAAYLAGRDPAMEAVAAALQGAH